MSKKIDWQFFIDPVNAAAGNSLQKTAQSTVLSFPLEIEKIHYNGKKIPAYKIDNVEDFNLFYNSRNFILQEFQCRLRFFMREGKDGAVHLKNSSEMKSAVKRSISKAVKLQIGNKRIIADY